MPSPFPGMDPYLEVPDLWQPFHGPFMTYVRDALQPQLPEGYVALVEMRLYVEHGGGNGRPEQRQPDLDILRRTTASARPRGSAVAVPEAPAHGYVIPAPRTEHREAFVNIRTTGSHKRVITSVELLSPANKQAGHGWEEYRRKQDEMLQAGINLVEIDVLRGGQHTVAVPREDLAGFPEYDYLACVFRDADSAYEVFPWTLRVPLPNLPVPLERGLGEVTLPLQRVLAQAYDNGLFDELLDYDGPPPVPLRPEDAAWADALLREAGLRAAP